jgi:lysyl-tRNA synthetase class 2
MDEQEKWYPRVPLSVLKKRAEVFATIRHFFAKRNVLEVDTPILMPAGVTDPQLTNLITHFHGSIDSRSSPLFLQTSPEYAMKRLLAAGSGCIYQLGKVFRDGDLGRYHHPEFTLLEWYRLGFTYHQLMDELQALIEEIINGQQWQRITYQDLFEQHLEINPHRATTEQLQKLARLTIECEANLPDKEAWLDLLMTHALEPILRQMDCVFVVDYPASQAALAQTYVNQQGDTVAKRFELYINGVEVANGYQELTNANELYSRFLHDQQKRAEQNAPPAHIDETFLAAMRAGLPDCAGVAVGIDRLLMAAIKATHIQDILPFSLHN